MKNKPWLKDVIRCPSCQTPLSLEKLSNGSCEHCGLGTTNTGKIVTFLNPEAPAQLDKEVSTHSSKGFQSLRTAIANFHEKRIEKHYQETLTDLSLANSWAQHYLQGLDIKPNSRILDYGCGRGRVLGFLQQLGYSTVGLDMTQSDWWEQLTKTSFVVTPPQLPQVPFCDESFDVVLNIDSTHYFTANRLEKHAKEIKRILRPKGVWIILQVNPDGYNMPRITDDWFGRFHTLTQARQIANDVGFQEKSHSFEGLTLPIPSKIFNTARHLINPWPLNVNDYDSFLPSMIPQEKRHRWLLRVQKSESQ